MTTHHNLKEQLHTIGDLKGVLSAMKNIALMETKKVVRFIENEHRSIEVLNQVAADFFSFHPPLEQTKTQSALLVLGSERGFCGDFNDAIIRTLLTQLETTGGTDSVVIAVGTKLGARLPSSLSHIEKISGAGFAEEVDVVMRNLMTRLEGIANLKVTVIYHDGKDNKVHVLEPLSWLQSNGSMERSRYLSQPQLHLDARVFVAGFVQRYVLTVLQYVFFGSLLSENIFRLRHLEDAVRRMEQRLGELKRKANAFRQEEITEELEIIMLTSNRSVPS